jgi:hypothetical protein
MKGEARWGLEEMLIIRVKRLQPPLNKGGELRRRKLRKKQKNEMFVLQINTDLEAK